MRKIIWLVTAVFFISYEMPVFGQADLLNNTERKDLINAQEEGKLALDVYVSFGKIWNLSLFERAAKTELRMLGAIEKEIRTLKQVDLVVQDLKNGDSSLKDLPTLRDELVSGSQSVLESLAVGAKLQEEHIVAGVKAIARTENINLIMLYDQLVQVSEHQLRAFAQYLEEQGVNYEPVILDKQRYNNIVKADLKTSF